MKKIKKIVILIFILIALIITSGYFYFDTKFSPEENFLKVANESGKVKIVWLDNNRNAMLLPISFKKDTTTYYLQFDTGSPSTVFYQNAVKNIPQLKIKGNLGTVIFKIGETEVESKRIKIIDFGKDSKDEHLKIIGTLGSDILDKRKSIINFKENYIQFNLKTTPSNFKGKTFDFSYKKRKIIIPTKLKDKDEKYLYDSGTSAYELLTNKENWQKLKTPNSKIMIEKVNSWGKTLTTYTAKSNDKIEFGNLKIPLNQVTYVEGFSKTQYYLMKFSRMSGMLGNRIFLKNEIFIDCENSKIGIE